MRKLAITLGVFAVLALMASAQAAGVKGNDPSKNEYKNRVKNSELNWGQGKKVVGPSSQGLNGPSVPEPSSLLAGLLAGGALLGAGWYQRANRR